MKPENRMLDLLKRMSSLSVMKPPSESPLSISQVAMLNWVARSPGCGVREIAQGLCVTPPTISVGVRKLIKDGWLEQKEDPQDRRARPLFLTEKGDAFVEFVQQHHIQTIKAFLSGLSNHEQEQLISLLDRAISALETSQIEKEA
ncbi:MAG: MarR family winged helix-turn-helix transcriptional regulator [Anaerolineales bacterium]